MADIFISYAREDAETARRLAAELEKRGWSVFWDRRIPTGRRFDDYISGQLDAARCVIVLWSGAANSSGWVRDEAAEARDRNILAPALIEAVKPPMGFRGIHAADLIGWPAESAHAGFEQLLEDIAQYVPLASRAAERDAPDEIKAEYVPPAARAVKHGEPAVIKAGTVRTNPDDGEPYVWIPPGEFEMGDDEGRDDEKPRHMVRITRGFWLGQTPVTVGAYRRFAEKKGISMPAAPHFNPQWGDPDQPMVNVSWGDAAMYCESWAKGRLPTEAEWEYAARASSTGARYGKPDEIGWYAGNSGGQAQRVRQKRANAWGLYDMLGNVWEWVADWYDDPYYRSLPSPAIDPTGPASGTARVLRGGSWGDLESVLRAAVRLRYVPEYRNYYIGFRCARDFIA
jgi:formylglycine-generating enzyme required for sulfatase activity